MKKRILAILLCFTVVITTCFSTPAFAADGKTEKISGWKKFTNGVGNLWNSAKDSVSNLFNKSDDKQDAESSTDTPAISNSNSENDFLRGYNYVANLMGNMAAEFSSTAYIESIEQEILKLENNINSFGTKYNYPTDSSAGFLAEEWCAGTYNITAKANGADSYAYVPRSNQNGSADVVISTGESASLKYYDTANGSAGNQALAKYGNQQRIIPSDQVNEGLGCLNKMYDKAVQDGYTEVAEAIDTARNNLRDNIKSSDGTESIPLTKEQAEQIAKDAKNGNFKASDYGVTTTSVAKIGLKTVQGGVQSMLIAVPLAVAPDVIDMAMELAKSGEISSEDIRTLGTDAQSAAAFSFITGSCTSLISQLCKAGVFGESLKSPSAPTIALLVTTAGTCIQYVYRYVDGEITLDAMWDGIVASSLANIAGFGTVALLSVLIPAMPKFIFAALGIGISFLAVKYYDAGKQLVISVANSAYEVIVSAYGTCKEALSVAYEKTANFAKNASETIASSAVKGFNYTTDAVVFGLTTTGNFLADEWKYTKDFYISRMPGLFGTD